MDKLRAMETFIAVVECGSFSEAASRLDMSAVMVGKYIALIERQLQTLSTLRQRLALLREELATVRRIPR